MGLLVPEKYEKMLQFLYNPGARRGGTISNIECTNRRLRRFENILYKWRLQTIVRLLILALDRLRVQSMAGEQHDPGRIESRRANTLSTSTRNLSRRTRIIVFSLEL